MSAATQETYFDSADGVRITKSRAISELADHGLDRPEDIAQFYRECGDAPMYQAKNVLLWLGY